MSKVNKRPLVFQIAIVTKHDKTVCDLQPIQQLGAHDGIQIGCGGGQHIGAQDG